MSVLKLSVLLSICVTLLTICPSHAQESVCDLFRNLKASDGRQLFITGELIISSDFAALGAADCDNQYETSPEPHAGILWPTALRLRPSQTLPAKQLQQFQAAALEAERLRKAGKSPNASASFSGHLTLIKENRLTVGDLPAEFTFDSIEDLKVEALPDANTLAVIPICELFQNLQRWKGMRLAVKGESVNTMEGSWIVGHCKGAFTTNGYRWPVALDYTGPAYYSNEMAGIVEVKQSSSPPKEAEELRGRHDIVTTGTYVGRLRMRSEYTAVCTEEGEYRTNGFGHLNGAAAELIVEAVTDVELTPRVTTEGIDEPAEGLKCKPEGFANLCANAKSLVRASSLGCVDQVQGLLSRDGIDSKDGSESPALRVAIRKGNEPIVRMLLDAGAPVNPNKIADMPPLSEAAEWGQYTIMQLLLKAGANVDGLDHQGSTYLASYGFFNPSVAKLFLEAGANPNATGRDGQTALMNAAMHGYGDAVRLLVAHGADVNVKDNYGRSALMHAAAGQYVDAIPLLLERGADVHARDRDGNTALDIARKSGNMAAAELLSRQ